MSRLEIVKTFPFEAAHHLRGYGADHPNSRLHGHSFRVEVAIGAAHANADGFVLPFDRIDEVIQEVKARLDHGYLNEIEGLDQPTLENIAGFIAERVGAKLPGLARVSVYRDSLGEACHLYL